MEETHPVIDDRTLAEIRDLMAEDFGDFIERFLVDAADLLDGADRALADGDARGVELSAHTLKSSAASVGARALSEAACDLEASGRSRELSGAGPLLAQTRAELERAGHAFAVQIERKPST
ncbi:HPt domain-containing protein [Thioflavicoccus mobilis 8321]|uniref:HPt domain-containing protein n=1 Tax=Thioflavicoccus mobilis 8321 TaxID=765912 RepID=L0GRH3_9GAMM|nr:Hpt domain-containing protein [Thioflavicoccus mobilis]AGA89363.1 HPt domain-containing protein [Thioflavicoccus mobilis 8321]